MSWFGFGFNGFGQIKLQQKDENKKQLKVLTPEKLVCSERPVTDQPGQEIQRITACWSQRATFHRNGECHVRLVGFGNDNIKASGVSIPESEGCDDALISEDCLTLRFAHRVECWSLKRNERALVWSGNLDATETGQDVQLPLIPGGYMVSKTPFFRPLFPHLQALNLALGTNHAVLLTTSGAVYTWGSGNHGQLGHSNLVSEDDPRIVEALWGVPMRSVSAGGWHSACISAGGDLYMWGWNESGQLGLPSKGLREESHEEKCSGGSEKGGFTVSNDESSSQVLISIQAFPALVDVSESSEISKISCGSRHTAAITSSGELYTWGWGHYGQLGHGTENSLDEPKLVEDLSGRMRADDVVCGSWNTFVFTVPEHSSPS